jgi:hypothetical protein
MEKGPMWIFDWVRVLEPKIDGKRIPVESNQKERGISLSTVVESQSFREKPHLLIGLKKTGSRNLPHYIQAFAYLYIASLVEDLRALQLNEIDSVSWFFHLLPFDGRREPFL